MTRLRTIGGGNNGTAVQLLSVPQNGKSLAFPLTPSTIMANQSPTDMVAAGFTLETWLYVNAFESAPDYLEGDQAQFLLLPAGLNGSGYSFQWVFVVVTNEDGSRSGRLSIFNYAGGTVQSTTTFGSEQWVHVATTYNPTTLDVQHYLNGQSAGGGVVSAPFPPAHTFDLGHVGSYRPWRMLNGSLDEFRWWRQARTQAQIMANIGKRNGAIPGSLDPAVMCCCFGFEDINLYGNPAQYHDASGNGLVLQDSYNSSGGTQRGSTAPLEPMNGQLTKILTA